MLIRFQWRKAGWISRLYPRDSTWIRPLFQFYCRDCRTSQKRDRWIQSVLLLHTSLKTKEISIPRRETHHLLQIANSYLSFDCIKYGTKFYVTFKSSMRFLCGNLRLYNPLPSHCCPYVFCMWFSNLQYICNLACLQYECNFLNELLKRLYNNSKTNLVFCNCKSVVNK